MENFDALFGSPRDPFAKPTPPIHKDNYIKVAMTYDEGKLVQRVGEDRQRDPKGLSAKTPGAKMDAGKSPVFRGLLDYFPRACMAVAVVSKRGAEKYSWKGFAQVEDAVNRYADAGARHILLEAIEGERDAETGLLHKAQKAWNALAELEMFLRERDGHPISDLSSTGK